MDTCVGLITVGSKRLGKTVVSARGLLAIAPWSIQDFEKIRILRSELKGNKLNRLNNELQKFAPVVVGPEVNVEQMLQEGRALLRTLE